MRWAKDASSEEYIFPRNAVPFEWTVPDLLNVRAPDIVRSVIGLGHPIPAKSSSYTDLVERLNNAGELSRQRPVTAETLPVSGHGTSDMYFSMGATHD